MRSIYLSVLYLTLFGSTGAQAQENKIGLDPPSNPQLQWSRSLPPSINLRSEAQTMDQRTSATLLGTESAPDSKSLSFKSDISHDQLVRKWSIMVSDKTLYRTMRRWAQEAGYQLMWQVDRDFPIEVDVAFNVDFRNALEQVMAGVALTDYPIQALVNPSARVLRVVRHQDDGRR
jgi:hypothetical protein